MPTVEEVAKQPLEQRLGHMSRTAEDLAAAIRGQNEAALVRPDGKNWAANEIICHLRDSEGVFFARALLRLSSSGVAEITVDNRRAVERKLSRLPHGQFSGVLTSAPRAVFR
jgi:hypothetical protein